MKKIRYFLDKNFSVIGHDFTNERHSNFNYEDKSIIYAYIFDKHLYYNTDDKLIIHNRKPRIRINDRKVLDNYDIMLRVKKLKKI